MISSAEACRAPKTSMAASVFVGGAGGAAGAAGAAGAPDEAGAPVGEAGIPAAVDDPAGDGLAAPLDGFAVPVCVLAAFDGGCAGAVGCIGSLGAAAGGEAQPATSIQHVRRSGEGTIERVMVELLRL
jgi:hypothetical protein